MLPDTTPAPPRKHWAGDPVQRSIFIGVGPIVVLITGLWKAGPETYSRTTFLFANPLVCVGLIGAMLMLSEEAAARYEGRAIPKSRRVPALLMLGLAFLAFPLAMVVQGEFPIWGLIGPAAGLGIVVALFAWPKRGPSANWLMVPLAVGFGGLCAAMIVVLGVIVSLMSWSTPPDPTFPVLLFWIGGGLIGYMFMAMVRGTADKPVDTGTKVNGAAATLLASLASALLAIYLLS